MSDSEEMVTTPRRNRLPKQLPFPVSLEVSNMLPVEMIPAKRIRHDHTIKLLYQVRLEIFVNQTELLYDCCLEHQTTHPSWLHFTEFIAFSVLSVEDYETMIARISVDSATSTRDRVTLLQIPIHPSKLVRIENGTNIHLPLNAVLITFSDDSIRVPPSLYNSLVEQGQLAPQQHIDKDIEFGRFKDNAFHALDGVSPGRMSTSLLETDDPSLASPVRNHAVPSTYNDMTFEDKDVRRCRNPLPPDNLYLNHDDDEGSGDDADDLLREQRYLEELLSLESTSLDRDLEILKQENDEIRSIQESVGMIHKQIKDVREAKDILHRESYKSDFLVDFQRIRLFRELRIVYPIALVASEQRYKIRDLEIASDMNAGLVSDEETNAALGCLCHTLAMMGKYLSMQYRYRIYYHSSRSAIQDDRAVVYPLFLGRNIERDHFEHGLKLLYGNVDCLITAREIRVSPKLHVLGKVKRIYESVIDGY